MADHDYPEELVDAIAHALATRFGERWDSLDDVIKEDLRQDAVAALKAVSDQGYTLVKTACG
jgi:hypothetical protein